jgi:hypothetical protein
LKNQSTTPSKPTSGSPLKTPSKIPAKTQSKHSSRTPTNVSTSLIPVDDLGTIDPRLLDGDPRPSATVQSLVTHIQQDTSGRRALFDSRDRFTEAQPRHHNASDYHMGHRDRRRSHSEGSDSVSDGELERGSDRGSDGVSGGSLGVVSDGVSGGGVSSRGGSEDAVGGSINNAMDFPPDTDEDRDSSCPFPFYLR